MNNLILVTDWEKVTDPNDFYLTDEWAKNEGIESIKKARELQKEGKLLIAYIVDAKNYAIYSQMDADCVYIDQDGHIVLRAESAIIGNNHQHREACELY